MKNRGTQSPSLSPLSTFSPWRIRDGMRSSVTTAWPSAASVHASTIASTSASVKLIPGITRRADQGSGEDRERQADPQQPQRHRKLVVERAQRDPRRVPEQHQRQRDLGEQLDLFAAQVKVQQPEHRPGEQAGAGEEHRARDVQSFQPPRDRRVGDQQRCNRRQSPGHSATLERPSRPDRPRSSSDQDEVGAPGRPAWDQPATIANVRITGFDRLPAASRSLTVRR